MTARSFQAKKIAVISLGGTITMTGAAGGGAIPSLGSDALVSKLADGPGVEIVPITLKTIPSAELTPPDLLEVARHADGLAEDGYAGIVVVQGTDTVEETAFVLDTVATRSLAIVVSGAMRHADSPGADGAANLRDAVATAASDEAKKAGVLAVFDGQIHAARFVHKAATSSVGAFRSTPAGAIGWATEGSPTFAFSSLPELVRLPLSAIRSLPKVACLPACIGEDGDIAQMAVDAGYGGLVIMGMGGGHVPPAFADRLETIASRIPVVLTTRVTGGEVLKRTYGFKGSEMDLLRRGVILAGWLQTAKARLLLMLMLAAGYDRDRIAEGFGRCGGHAVACQANTGKSG